MNIQEPQTIELLTEMCKRVGQDYDTFDFSGDKWFWKHEWTQEEQDSFRDWLAEKLVKWKIVKKRKGNGRFTPIHEADKIVCNYGWKIKK